MSECTEYKDVLDKMPTSARVWGLGDEVYDRAVKRGEIKVKAFHKANTPRADIEYVTYNDYSPPKFQMLNGMWVKVAKGVPRTMKDGCARKIFKEGKKKHKRGETL